jgi:hypothetical protein
LTGVAELLGTLLRAPFARHQLQDLIEGAIAVAGVA